SDVCSSDLTATHPPKDGIPFLTILVNAAAVSSCICSITDKSVCGSRLRQRFFPLSDAAWSARSCIILSYSNLRNVFVFMKIPCLYILCQVSFYPICFLK